MTILADRIPVDEITARGRQVRPGRALLTLFLGLFMLPGWIAGRTLLIAADCVVSFRVGYWRGREVTEEEITRRLQQLSGAARHEAPPGG